MNKKMTDEELFKAIEEAQKDPEFVKDIEAFIKATT